MLQQEDALGVVLEDDVVLCPDRPDVPHDRSDPMVHCLTDLTYCMHPAHACMYPPDADMMLLYPGTVLDSAPTADPRVLRGRAGYCHLDVRSYFRKYIFCMGNHE